MNTQSEQPGGDDYLKPFPKDTGKVRPDWPKDNPPEKAIDAASARLKKQAAKQKQQS